ncbi:MAG: hypothetical protein L0Z50_34510 [Verrucomicrobiales bacterium]|nr:hypothetical protein [Verrucomicrobiales bacterium]
MKNLRSWMASASFIVLVLAGCRAKDESPAAAAPMAPDIPPAEDSAAPAGPPTSAAISSVRDSLKSGNVDEAAARLAQLQLHGASFNAQQAKDYRQAISDAYDRAIEAAQRGDPKGEAALKLLRAAAPR